MEYYSTIEKNEIFAICDSMHGLGQYYAKWNKSERERQIQYDLTYMWNLKNKRNKQNRLIDKNKLVFARTGGGVNGRWEIP